VPLKTDAYYRRIAEEAVRQTAIVEPPVAVDAVAVCAGVPVRFVRLPKFFSGAAVNEDGRTVLVINAMHDEFARRRCLAHLLAHVLILLDDDSEGYPRDMREDHREADIVAEEIVLPSNMLIEQANKWFNDYRYLARIFSVGETEVLERMQRLGLLKDRGFVWEY
jgi:Zn-dependent peptidase ImmA (M78 family)